MTREAEAASQLLGGVRHLMSHVTSQKFQDEFVRLLQGRLEWGAVGCPLPPSAAGGLGQLCAGPGRAWTPGEQTPAKSTLAASAEFGCERAGVWFRVSGCGLSSVRIQPGGSNR